jgi:hypothetical protein
LSALLFSHLEDIWQVAEENPDDSAETHRIGDSLSLESPDEALLETMQTV